MQRRAFFRRPVFGAALFERQKAKGEHGQGGVMVEASPTAALEVVESEFFFHLLIALLDLPTLAPEPHRPQAWGVRGQVAKGVLDGAVGLLLNE